MFFLFLFFLHLLPGSSAFVYTFTKISCILCPFLERQCLSYQWSAHGQSKNKDKETTFDLSHPQNHLHFILSGFSSKVTGILRSSDPLRPLNSDSSFKKDLRGKFSLFKCISIVTESISIHIPCEWVRKDNWHIGVNAIQWTSEGKSLLTIQSNASQCSLTH